MRQHPHGLCTHMDEFSGEGSYAEWLNRHKETEGTEFPALRGDISKHLANVKAKASASYAYTSNY